MNYAAHYVRTGHDPLSMMHECETCKAIIRRVFNDMADSDDPTLNFGPHDVDSIMAKIRDMAANP